MSHRSGQKAAIKRDEKGRIVPGSGALHPGGRPPLTDAAREARKAAELHTPEAVATIVDLMRNANDERVRLHAASKLFDKIVPDALDGPSLAQSNPWAGFTPEQVVEIARQSK